MGPGYFLRKMIKLTKYNVSIALIILVGVVIRFLYMYIPETKMSYDEATAGLQALHIFNNGETPVFFYNQPYTGSLPTYISAALFGVLGVSDLWVKFVPFLFSIGFLITFYYLAREVLKSDKGVLFSLIVASLASPFWINWTTRAGTGYPEMMVFGNLLLLITLKIAFNKLSKSREFWYFFIWGVCAGLGYWIQPTIVYYILPSLLFIFLSDPRVFLKINFYAIVPGFLIGALPAVIWNFNNRNLTNRSIFHKPFGVLGSMRDFFTLGMPVLVGVRRPSSTENLLTPLAVLVGLSYLATFLYYLIVRGKEILSKLGGILEKLTKFSSISSYLQPIDLIFLHTIAVFCVFSLSSPFNQFVIEPRYISALYTSLPILLAYFFIRLLNFRQWLGLSFAAVLIFNGMFSLLKVLPNSFIDQFDLEPVVQYLEQKGIKYVYAEAAYSYQLVLETQESIIATPIDNLFVANRYPDYIETVKEGPLSQKACVIYKEKNDCTFAFGDSPKELKEIGKFKVYTIR